jgi:hypothetical protein
MNAQLFGPRTLYAFTTRIYYPKNKREKAEWGRINNSIIDIFCIKKINCGLVVVSQ